MSMQLVLKFCLVLSFSIIFAAEAKTKKAINERPPKIEVKTPAPVAELSGEDLKKYHQLMEDYKRPLKDKNEMAQVKEKTLELSNKAVPILVKVMKDSSFPDKNRWIATFLLGRIMGEKASPFIAKFVHHPHWILRLASLKTLLGLKSKKHGVLYSKALNDDSMIVRVQALENIRLLGLDSYAPSVWAMLYDKRNYAGEKGPLRRTNIIKNAVKAIGDLKFGEAKSPLLSMAQKKKYDDIFEEIDYSLQKLTGKESPVGNSEVKRHFWNRISMNDKVF